MLTYVNDKAARFFSAGTFFVGVAASITVSWVYAGVVNDIVRTVTSVGLPSLAVLAVMCFGFGWAERKSRKAMIDRIKEKSRPVGR